MLAIYEWSDNGMRIQKVQNLLNWVTLTVLVSKVFVLAGLAVVSV